MVQTSLHFVLFNLIYGTWMLVQGIELRRTARPCTPVPSHGGKRTRPEPGRAGVEVSMLIGNSRRWLLAAAVFPLVLAGCAGQGAGTGTAGTPAGPGTAASGSHRGLSAVRHVWVIELENQGYQQSFGTPSADPYLARILPRMGALLENYYAIGHASADNYIAEISGQAPSLGTQADCPVWIPFPGNAVAGPYHQVLGEGCVYPAQVQTLGNQLSGAGLSWAAYLQDMGNVGAHVIPQV